MFLEGADHKENVTVKKLANMHDIAILSITSDRLFVFWKQLTKRKMSNLKETCKYAQHYNPGPNEIFGVAKGFQYVDVVLCQVLVY